MRRLGMVLLAILFLFMVFAGPVTQKTDAVVVSTVVIGAVIAAMAAAGIGLSVSGLTSAQLQEWVSGKLNDWATSLGGSVQDHIDSNQITITGRGFLSLGTLAAQGISNFIDWLKIEDSITDNSTENVLTGNSTFNGYDVAVLPTGLLLFNLPGGVQKHINYYNNSYTCYYYFDQNWAMQVISPASFIYYYIQENNDTTTWALDGPKNGYYYGSGLAIAPSERDKFQNIQHSISARNMITNDNEIIQGGAIDYNTGVITVPTIQEGDKWFLDVGAEPGVTVQTATDGVIADTIDGSLTVSGEVAEEEPEFEVTGPIGVSGLTEVFPFCIPFDVYALLSCLSAEPQTPIFTVRFVIPGVINQEFTIDLSPFSTIAQIVRTMELIAFAIGLALVTRERFLRS